MATSSAGTGVQGEAPFFGVVGKATETVAALTFGVIALNANTAGTGVHGRASATTGATVGMLGRVNSPSGTAGVFHNTAGGVVLEGRSGPAGSVVFRVDGGVGIGVVAPAATLEVRVGGTTLADAWSVYSSRRWKTNIQPLAGALGKVERLRGLV